MTTIIGYSRSTAGRRRRQRHPGAGTLWTMKAGGGSNPRNDSGRPQLFRGDLRARPRPLLPRLQFGGDALYGSESHGFPILRRRFHDYFFGLLLDQPCSERSQLFGVAAKHPPLKLVLADNFHVRHNHCQYLFMNIDSRYSVGHHFLLAGSGERAADTLTRLAGYRRSPRGRQRRPIIRSSRTLRIRQGRSFNFSTECSTSPRRTGPILPLTDFHEVSRAAGPKGQGRNSRNELTGMLKKLFRKDGPVFDTTNFRREWIKACVKLGLGKMTGEEWHQYGGLIPHDFRRSAVRNLIQAGVDQSTAMRITGHRTVAVFQRYNIVSTEQLHEAMAKVSENANCGWWFSKQPVSA